MLAAAQNPHFVRATSSQSGNNLICSFKEAGLGGGQTVTISCSADATAEYECQNRGHNNKNPPAENKHFETGTVEASGDFTASKNGQITDTLTLTPPGPGDFTCPPGQDRVIVSATYDNVVIRDETNGITA